MLGFTRANTVARISRRYSTFNKVIRGRPYNNDFFLSSAVPVEDIWFGESNGGSYPRPLRWKPVIDVKESEDTITISSELAGVDPDDVHVDVNHDFITISGEKKVEVSSNKKENYSVAERAYGKFFRKLPITVNIDRDNIQANFENGVLKVLLPKQHKKSSRIKINVVKPQKE